MITLLTGKTGSGKSYYAVSKILKVLDTGRRVFTNLKLNVEYENYVYLDELEVKKYLLFIDSTFSNVDNLEDKKHELQNTIYYESDFFIDEAHLVGFRDKKEAVLNWLTIHRHFNQNITVITQVPSNVHRDYLMLFHTHIDMIPPNKRLSKNSMGYKQYDAYKGDRIKTSYFKPIADVFNIYNSGNVEQAVNKDVFKLIALVIGLLFLIGLAWYSISSFFDRDGRNLGAPITENKDKNILDLNTSDLIVTPTLKKSIDNNVTVIVKKENSVLCSDLNGCYYSVNNYTLNEFRLFVLSKYKNYTQSVIAIISSNGKKETITKYVLND